MRCPDDNILGRLLDGGVDDAERMQLEAHLDGCELCSHLVAELARGTPAELDDTLPSSAGDSVALEAGMTIGRFTLIERLGAGGMGVVWAAHDPQLDRKIALKFVRTGVGKPDMLVRLEREAKALARVNHPNVVAVHDIGTDRNRIYIAQELVAGCDLAAWRSAQPRTVREIVATFVQAARGLAAAHNAGIVHRDFKPSNVLVGDDGRVRVVDFGVSRSAEPDDDSRVVETTPASTAEPRLTVTGAAVGTPLYMSPEQHLGERSDARSDQFSFCVALAEALYGEVPFTGTNAADYAIAVVRGQIRPAPTGAHVPGWLRAIVLRGLSGKRDERFPTMDAVIAALESDPTRARRRNITVAAAALVVIGSIGAAYATGDRTEKCTGGSAQLAQVWNEPHRAQARTAFLATKLPFAQTAWSRVERVLDRYGKDWIAAHKASCEATVRGEQSSQAMDLRMSCLDQRLGQIAAARDAFARADRQTVEHAGQVASALGSIRDCADIASLQAIAPPHDAAAKRDVDAVRNQLAAVKATMLSGKYQDALEPAQAAVKAARATSYPPVVAEALLGFGQLQHHLRDDKAAEATLREAYVAAIAAGHGETATLAAATLLLVTGIELARGEDGEWWAQIAKAGVAKRAAGDRTLAADVAMRSAELAIVRGRHDEAITELRGALAVVATDPLRAAMIHGALGEALFRSGKYPEALDEHRRALAMYQAELGAEHPHVAIAHNGIGVTLDHMGKADEAMAEHQRALTIVERSFGPDHPDVAGTRTNIAIVLFNQMKLAEALAEYEKVLALQEAKLGAKHPNVGRTHRNIGNVYRRMGKPDEAIAEFRRELAIMETVYGPSHAETGNAHYNIGAALLAQLQDDAALVELHAALRVWSEALGPKHPQVGFVHGAIGAVLMQKHKFDDARVHFEKAIAIEEVALGPEHVNLTALHDNLGTVLHYLKRDAEAIVHHRRALAIQDLQKVTISPNDRAIMVEHLAAALIATGAGEQAIEDLEKTLAASDKLTDADLVAQLQFDLAQALWTAGRDRARAKQLARAALVVFRKVPDAAEDRVLVERWLAKR